ncbi:hypothetical protein BKA69DRAFT_662938 [Paraphysoderma sedebokerense]|nr:hypothetical protein BKA69DRAFT_662938 [Paraphysoderma sedebokerense]
MEIKTSRLRRTDDAAALERKEPDRVRERSDRESYSSRTRRKPDIYRPSYDRNVSETSRSSSTHFRSDSYDREWKDSPDTIPERSYRSPYRGRQVQEEKRLYSPPSSSRYESDGRPSLSISSKRHYPGDAEVAASDSARDDTTYSSLNSNDVLPSKKIKVEDDEYDEYSRKRWDDLIWDTSPGMSKESQSSRSNPNATSQSTQNRSTTTFSKSSNIYPSIPSSSATFSHASAGESHSELLHQSFLASNGYKSSRSAANAHPRTYPALSSNPTIPVKSSQSRETLLQSTKNQSSELYREGNRSHTLNITEHRTSSSNSYTRSRQPPTLPSEETMNEPICRNSINNRREVTSQHISVSSQSSSPSRGSAIKDDHSQKTSIHQESVSSRSPNSSSGSLTLRKTSSFSDRKAGRTIPIRVVRTQSSNTSSLTSSSSSQVKRQSRSYSTSSTRDNSNSPAKQIRRVPSEPATPPRRKQPKTPPIHSITNHRPVSAHGRDEQNNQPTTSSTPSLASSPQRAVKSQANVIIRSGVSNSFRSPDGSCVLMKNIRMDYVKQVATKKWRSICFNEFSHSDLFLTSSLDGDVQQWSHSKHSVIRKFTKKDFNHSWSEALASVGSDVFVSISNKKVDITPAAPVSLLRFRHDKSKRAAPEIFNLSTCPHDIARGLTAVTGVLPSDNCYRFYTGGTDRSIYLWEILDSSFNSSYKTLSTNSYSTRPIHSRHTSAIQTIVRNNNNLISGGLDSKIISYDVVKEQDTFLIKTSARVNQIIPDPSNPHLITYITTQKDSQSIHHCDIRLKTSTLFNSVVSFNLTYPKSASIYLQGDVNPLAPNLLALGTHLGTIAIFDLKFIKYRSVTKSVNRNGSSRVGTWGEVRPQTQDIRIGNTDVLVTKFCPNGKGLVGLTLDHGVGFVYDYRLDSVIDNAYKYECI